MVVVPKAVRCLRLWSCRYGAAYPPTRGVGGCALVRAVVEHVPGFVALAAYVRSLAPFFFLAASCLVEEPAHLCVLRCCSWWCRERHFRLL